MAVEQRGKSAPLAWANWLIPGEPKVQERRSLRVSRIRGCRRNNTVMAKDCGSVRLRRAWALLDPVPDAVRSIAVQQLAHGAGVIKKFLLQLRRQRIPLHDQRRPQTPQDMVLFRSQSRFVGPTGLWQRRWLFEIIGQFVVIIGEPLLLSASLMRLCSCL